MRGGVEFTPSTVDVAVAYRVAGAVTGNYADLAVAGAKYGPEFARWLDGVRAEAWDEGEAAGQENGIRKQVNISNNIDTTQETT